MDANGEKSTLLGHAAPKRVVSGHCYVNSDGQISWYHSKSSDGAVSTCVVMENGILAMEEIETSSKAISNFTKLIEEIAFQTSLLASNAGVEAARAGESGRGFADVANEVRALAQRSSEAVDDINSVVAKTTSQISNGANLAPQSGQSLKLMVDTISDIAQHINEIAISSSNQIKNLSQIDSAVRELDEVTKHNADLLTETTSAGHQLKQETSNLANVCSALTRTAILCASPIEVVRP